MKERMQSDRNKSRGVDGFIGAGLVSDDSEASL